jgi:photosystem II stability/assembly factor-like uncharacterized protein
VRVARGAVPATLLAVALLAVLAGGRPPDAHAALYAGNGSWAWQNPLPQGNHLGGLAFVDRHNGWAVGTAGTILHTTDSGATWTQQPSGTSETLFAVRFTSPTTGWTAGAAGTILNTSDGGLT